MLFLSLGWRRRKRLVSSWRSWGCSRRKPQWSYQTNINCAIVLVRFSITPNITNTFRKMIKIIFCKSCLELIFFIHFDLDTKIRLKPGKKYKVTIKFTGEDIGQVKVPIMAAFYHETKSVRKGEGHVLSRTVLQ